MLSRAERQAATVVLMLIVGVLLVLVYLVTNDTSRANADDRVREEQIGRGQQLFAANCAVCHGTHGQGGVGLPLNIAANRPTSDAQATQRSDYLTRTITNGRPGTFMPAWALQNGGPLNVEQIGALVTMIEYGNWDETQAVVDAYQMKNGTPPPPTNPQINTGGIGGNPALATVGPCPSNVQNPSAPPTCANANAAASAAAGATPQAGGGAPAAQFVGDGHTINATEKDFAIAMDTSLVKPGSVTFKVTNSGPSPHNIGIKEMNKFSPDVNPGQSATFTIDNVAAGTYTVICSIAGHEQLGMHVTLKVADTAASAPAQSATGAPGLTVANAAPTALAATKPDAYADITA